MSDVARLFPALVACALVLATAGCRARSKPDDAGAAAYVAIVGPRGDLADPPARFEWRAVEGAVRYTVKIEDADAVWPLFVRTTSLPSLTLEPREADALLRDRVHVWEVQAFDEQGTLLASAGTRFRVLPAPATPHFLPRAGLQSRAMELALETHGLSRSFGDLLAVDGIDLAVPKGSLYGFLGPNGAGKSTTIKCLTGLLRPTSGTMRILGIDPLLDPVAVKRLVGVVPEDLALFERLTGMETLSFVGQVHGLDRGTIGARAAELLSLMDLVAAAGSLVADYSHGMRKKLALATALLPAPRMLFLDEPFEGIDAVASHQIKNLLHEFAKNGGTIFLTSHILEIVERLCDHLGVIHRGKLVAQGASADLRAGVGVGKTLEQIFLELVGATGASGPSLDWLGR